LVNSYTEFKLYLSSGAPVMRLFGRKLNVHIRKMDASDVDQVREVGRRAWSDLYSREFQQNFEVPMRSRENILFYLEKEPEGCMVAESDGRVVGDIFCHIWGSVGWFGPVEVIPSQQNAGIGKQLIRTAFTFLEEKSCSIIGLETMPETVKNVHLYSELGCVPDRATYLMEKQLNAYLRVRQKSSFTFRTFAELGEQEALNAVKRLSSLPVPGMDYSKEVFYSMKHNTGETVFLIEGGEPAGFALVYTYSTSDGSSNASIRFLVIDRTNSVSEKGEALIEECERIAREAGRDRMHVRFYTGNFAVYRVLKQSGYQLRGTNLRMLYKGDVPFDGQIYHISSWAG